ncbi:protein-tyrosine phosphatase-like protein [Scleroderma yunnanense]
MAFFPATSWQAALIQKVVKGRPQTYANSGPCGRVATPITKRLYLSDLFTARTPGNLKRLGITHVVSAIEADVSQHFDKGVVVMHVPIKDTSDTNIAIWFDRVVEFIGKVLDTDKNNKVLVHCAQGISRSAILVCAYLVATTHMGALEAIAYVQAKRAIVAPNLGFRHQLVSWAHRVEQAKRN